MQTKFISTMLMLLFTSVMLAPVSADSRWTGNGSQDRHYQKRGDGDSKYGRTDRLQNQYSRNQQKNSRSNNNNFNSGHYQPGSKSDRQHRHYSTQRHQPRISVRDGRKVQHQHYGRDYRDHRWGKRRYELRRGNRLLLLTPRHRLYRNIYIVRPFGHSYFGYGHFINDHQAWRWLAFSAITLKLLDLVDEQAQREHEAAQIDATRAEIGEKIYWDTDDASGYVVTTREGASSRGLTCREYQHSITVGGKTEEAYGTACLQPDGAWKIIN